MLGFARGFWGIYAPLNISLSIYNIMTFLTHDDVAITWFDVDTQNRDQNMDAGRIRQMRGEQRFEAILTHVSSALSDLLAF